MRSKPPNTTADALTDAATGLAHGAEVAFADASAVARLSTRLACVRRPNLLDLDQEGPVFRGIYERLRAP